jgi:CheY-like chemotaxis protein
MSANVLVVDDNPLNLKLMADILEPEPCRVRCVATGQEALAAVAAEAPDLILLDIMMPGMDGFEVVRRLKADPATRAIPIVIVTALDDDGARARLGAAGIDQILTKPIDWWRLSALLKQVLGNDKEKAGE